MNESFSWTRFGRLVRAELAGERRMLLFKIGGFALLCLLMYSLANISVIFRQSEPLESDIILPRMIVITWFTVFVLVNLSRSFKNYFSPGRAVEAFMVPAARSEKFLYAVLKNMIVVPLTLAIILFVNDWFWASVLFGFKNLSELSGALWHVINIKEPTGFIINLLSFSVLIPFSVLAFFLAGAVVFRKHQYLWTLLALFVLNIPVIILLQIEPGVLHPIERAFDSTLGLTLLNAVVLGWGALWIYVAWRRFASLPLTR